MQVRTVLCIAELRRLIWVSDACCCDCVLYSTVALCGKGGNPAFTGMTGHGGKIPAYGGMVVIGTGWAIRCAGRAGASAKVA